MLHHPTQTDTEREKERERRESMSLQEVQACSHRPQHKLWGPVNMEAGGRERKGADTRYRETGCSLVSTGFN